MKIAYLINQYPMVSHTFIRREIQALERSGVNVYRIAIRGWDENLFDEQDQLERKRTHYVLKKGAISLLLAIIYTFLMSPIRFVRAITLATRLAFRRSERPLAIHLIYVAEACRVLLWLRREGIQHLHAHFGTNSAEVAMLAHVLGGPTWSVTVHGPAEFDRKPLLNLPEKIKRSAFVVAISSYGRSQLYRCVDHQHWSKIHVVHCGLESSFYTIPPSAIPESRRIVCVGRLCEPKGQLLLLEAKKLLLDRGVDFELVLAGDGEARVELEALSARYNLTDNVRFTGWISSDQVRTEIMAARALVLPSFAEGLPVVIMESMALRRPVITTYIAGIPELVSSGEHGWLIPAGDIEALANALGELFATPSEVMLKMGEAARARVLSRHNIDVEAEKLRKLFQNSIEQQLKRKF
jgi:colanic acid/amylovoran biosynthesis glycosyltransferase